MQISNDSFDARNSDPAKAPDYAFVIAGWPTIYTVGRSDYTLAGDLANFTSIRAWADAPSGSAAKLKGRPEEGKMTIGEMNVEILDRIENGVRAISSLLSRQAYLEGNKSGLKTFLTAAIDKVVGSISVQSAAGLAAGDVVHVGLEAIKIGSIVGNTLQGCTRGYLLTSATPHANGVELYGFLPNYYRRKAFIYKGYRQLGLDKWLRAYSGVLGDAQKRGTKVAFSIMSTTWETWADGEKLAFNFGRSVVQPTVGGQVNADLLLADFSNIAVNVNEIGADLANGHFVLDVGGEIAGITGVV